MDKKIVDFLAALSNIDKTYSDVYGLNTLGNPYPQAAEGAFTAELYHQWKTLINNDSTGYYNGLQIHYDLTKERFEGKRPDLVLHESPYSRDKQRLYVEIKTSRSAAGYGSDFKKLILAVSPDNKGNQLGYVNAIFLSTTARYAVVRNSIKKYITNKNLIEDERLSRIYSIHLNSDYSIIIKSFSELI